MRTSALHGMGFWLFCKAEREGETVMLFIGEDGLRRVRGGALSPGSWLLGGVAPILTVPRKGPVLPRKVLS